MGGFGLRVHFDLAGLAHRDQPTYVRVARALGGLHDIDEAFAAGKISYSKVRAITRVATPETEQAFLDLAMHATAAQIERVAAAYRRTRVDPSQPNLEMRRFARRTETRSGMVRIDVQLPPEQANVVWEAMDAGRSEGGSASAEARPEGEADPSVLEAERADALVSVAQAYLEHDQPRTLGSGYALRLRDGGCRVPGCGRKYHLHAHHIEAWAEGGKTAQSNLVLLCPSHHALVHEGQLSVDVCDGKIEFKNAYGLTIPVVPPRPVDPETMDRWLYEVLIPPAAASAGSPAAPGPARAADPHPTSPHKTPHPPAASAY